MAETIRAFIAIRPSPDSLARIAEFQTELRSNPWATDFRWTDPTAIHLTLLFLGNVDKDKLPALTSALAEVAASAPPMRLEAAALGGFPSLRRPRVLWVGILGDLGQLAALQKEIRQRCSPYGAHQESGPFTPHLTIARARNPRQRQTMPPLEDARSFGKWTCDSVLLIESKLGPKGSEYIELASAPLHGKT